MKFAKTIAVLAVVGGLAGCTTAEQTAVVGAAAGGAIGAAVGGDLGSAAIGAFIGGVGGYLLGKSADGRCLYEKYPGGPKFYAQCP